MKNNNSSIVLFLLLANIILAKKLASIGQTKKEIMIFSGQLFAIPFIFLGMILLLRSNDPLNVVVIIATLGMIGIALILQLQKIADMIGKES